MNEWFEPVAVCAAALVLDQLLGEPRRWHPVVGFGTLASWLEQRLNQPDNAGIPRGLLAVTILVVPLTMMAWLMVCLAPPWLVPVLETLGLWLALSLRGLREHALAVAVPIWPIMSRTRAEPPGTPNWSASLPSCPARSLVPAFLS